METIMDNCLKRMQKIDDAHNWPAFRERAIGAVVRDSRFCRLAYNLYAKVEKLTAFHTIECARHVRTAALHAHNASVSDKEYLAHIFHAS
jgi:hypothetical protein